MAFIQLKKLVDNSDNLIICGMDEAGRGPWAGPVVASGVVFKKNVHLKGLKDSKELSEEKRELFYKKLCEKAVIGTGIASNAEIDKLGLIKATNLAFKRGLKEIEKQGINVNHLVIDGRDKFEFHLPFTSLVKGDTKVRLIACASVIAKVERDRIMKKMAKKYPSYGFEMHKGYGTKRHQKALKKHGVCEIHRKTFHPVSVLIQ